MRRFATAVFPAADDDVITSPYNAVLAAHSLVEHADCVFPVDNAALIDLVDRVERPQPGTEQRVGSITENGAGVRAAAGGRPVAPTHAFDAMNNLVAHMLANLTASVRFDGALGTVPCAWCSVHGARCRVHAGRLQASLRAPRRRLPQPLSYTPSGALNTDLSDITSNLVPFPRLHFLVPALAPLYAARHV